MKVIMTETLLIDLDSEKWHCRRCNKKIGSARKSYKEGMLVYERDPHDIHPTMLDPEKYEFTFAPDPEWIRILEYYCPSCGVMVETEYLPKGHPPAHDMEFDIDALREQWKNREELTEPAYGPDLQMERKVHRH